MNRNIQKLFNNRWALPTGVGACAFVGGTALGYVLGIRGYKPWNRKLESSKFYYPDNMPSVWDGDSSTSVSEDEVIPEHTYTNLELHWHEAPSPVIDLNQLRRVEEDGFVKPIKVQNTIWANPGEVWDYDREVAYRESLDPDSPYVISVEEFMNGESGFSQSTVTYYRKDQILCDEQDVPVYNHGKIFGDLKFGYGSDDPNVVYIRNPKMKREWEVLLSTGAYSEEVLGLEVETELSSRDLKHGILRMRPE